MKSGFLIVLLLFLATACSKTEVDNTGGNNGGGNNGGGNNGGGNTPAMIILFENSSFNGTAVVAYTDGSSLTANFQNGILRLPFSATKDKTIKSLTPQNQHLLLIGRTEGDSIILNYNNGVLNFRSAVAGYIPIGTYAEFQLINTKTAALAGNYELKYDLDLMNEEWNGIGAASPDGFYGVFEGGRHKLKNLKQTASNSGAGLFGYLNGNHFSVEIRNITISSGNITTNGRYAGAIAGLATGGVTFTGCENYASVTAGGNAAFAGGLVGEMGGTVSGGGTVYFKNSANYAEISITTASGVAGGLAGGAIFDVGCVADNCTNTAIIRGQYAGGIIGGMAASNNFFISNSSNKGNLIATTSAGGILGYGITAGISKCRNSGNITCSNSYEVGGIAGRCATVINSYNEGTITANIQEGVNYPVIGGVAGNVNTSAALGGNFNTGSITVTITRSYDNNIVVGGVIGSFPASSAASLSYSYNKGAITVSGNSPYRIIGGVIGTAYWNHSFDYCFNAAPIYSNIGNVGGLIGFATNSNPYVTSIFRCYWLDNADDNAVYEVGNWKGTLPAGTDIKKFSAAMWPSVSEGWIIGNGTSNAYWKSLGGWNNGSPVYPKLFYEE